MSTTSAPPASAPKVSEARERLVRVASELFYREGIHSVGMDRILAEASVTRATMYRHFSGKEALVAAYLEREDAVIRGYFTVEGDPSPADLITLAIEGIADDIGRYHTRGCPFINAAAEYPDASSEVRMIIARHREWFHATLRDALEAAKVPDADAVAGSLVMLRDAALVGGYLDGVEVARRVYVATARSVAGL
ncbi:TetR/AcrR family transcriptional regulator [Herbiconiux sp. CPCC 205763]|uniref:TetR/AcrR family transcriptional regulator n=1 Tax=Herbiconiux aconitum TaxID=2970913 RepID=A0ABT2GQB4_9MICO|nr:TetR/AcrR family transcriptional regulator [Herbiconiux aconitum]MCS5718373.1 TetR/AcrR family transcriptional regulator [Herbiconiux aconitum]